MKNKRKLSKKAWHFFVLWRKIYVTSALGKDRGKEGSEDWRCGKSKNGSQVLTCYRLAMSSWARSSQFLHCPVFILPQ